MANELIKQNNYTLITRMSGEFKKALANVITEERFTRVLLNALNKNHTLAEALNDPRSQPSVIASFMKCAEMGLEPDGRKATIVAYRSKKNGFDVQMIPMYQGLVEMAYRSGMISSIHADKICKNDIFEYNIGKIIKHVPDFLTDRGEPYAYYAHVTFKDGMTIDQVMTIGEINAIRDRSSGYQHAVKNGFFDNPWITDYQEMAKKTVFRRTSKWLPLSADAHTAFECDDGDYQVQPNPAKFDAFAAETINLITKSADDVPMETTADVVGNGEQEGLFDDNNA